MPTKLTLGIDAGVIEDAKRFAVDHGTSVSQLVEGFLSVLVRPPASPAATPVLHRLRGSLRVADVNEHRRWLESKYGCDDSSST